MPIPKKLEERYSVEDPSGNYRGIWFNDIPRDPTACFRYYLGVESKLTKKRKIIPAKRLYFGKDHPYLSLTKLEFREEGLVAEVQEITDSTGNRKLIHLAQNQSFRDISIRIPKDKFPI